MMIVADNKDREDPELLIMADDGRGGSVKIPSFLISKSDGKKLENEIHELQKQKDDNSIPPPPKNKDELPTTKEELDLWRRHKEKGRGKRVIISAEIDLATKTDGNVDVDLWYANIYELFNSGWDLVRYAEIQHVFQNRVKI